MRALAAACFALATLAACAAVPGAPLEQVGRVPPAQEPDIAGVAAAVAAFEPITQDCVDPDPATAPDTPVSSDDLPLCSAGAADVLGSVRIESADGDAAVVTVLESTSILRVIGDGREEVGFAALRQGQRVDAWFDGPVMESFPVQATAAALVIAAGDETAASEP